MRCSEDGNGCHDNIVQHAAEASVSATAEEEQWILTLEDDVFLHCSETPVLEASLDGVKEQDSPAKEENDMAAFDSSFIDFGDDNLWLS